MTHDELLAKVELTLGTYISKYYGSKKDVELRSDVIDSLQALRAVVELLKEYSDGQVRVNEEFNQGILALSNVIKEAIEKELK